MAVRRSTLRGPQAQTSRQKAKGRLEDIADVGERAAQPKRAHEAALQKSAQKATAARDTAAGNVARDVALTNRGIVPPKRGPAKTKRQKFQASKKSRQEQLRKLREFQAQEEAKKIKLLRDPKSGVKARSNTFRGGAPIRIGSEEFRITDDPQKATERLRRTSTAARQDFDITTGRQSLERLSGQEGRLSAARGAVGTGTPSQERRASLLNVEGMAGFQKAMGDINRARQAQEARSAQVATAQTAQPAQAPAPAAPPATTVPTDGAIPSTQVASPQQGQAIAPVQPIGLAPLQQPSPLGIAPAGPPQAPTPIGIQPAGQVPQIQLLGQGQGLTEQQQFGGSTVLQNGGLAPLPQAQQVQQAQVPQPTPGVQQPLAGQQAAIPLPFGAGQLPLDPSQVNQLLADPNIQARIPTLPPIQQQQLISALEQRFSMARGIQAPQPIAQAPAPPPAFARPLDFGERELSFLPKPGQPELQRPDLFARGPETGQGGFQTLPAGPEQQVKIALARQQAETAKANAEATRVATAVGQRQLDESRGEVSTTEKADEIENEALALENSTLQTVFGRFDIDAAKDKREAILRLYRTKGFGPKEKARTASAVRQSPYYKTIVEIRQGLGNDSFRAPWKQTLTEQQRDQYAAVLDQIIDEAR